LNFFASKIAQLTIFPDFILSHNCLQIRLPLKIVSLIMTTMILITSIYQLQHTKNLSKKTYFRLRKNIKWIDNCNNMFLWSILL